MSHYDDEEEFDIRVRRGASPARPVIYPERRHPRSVRTPIAYQHGSSSYLVPERVERTSEFSIRRSRSTGRDRRESSPPPPPPQPVIINNRIYNDHESDDEDRYVLSPPVQARGRSHSRSRPFSYHPPGYSESPPMDPRELFELEQSRKELEVLKLEARREEDEKHSRDHRELEAYKAKREREEDEKHSRDRRELEAYKAKKEREEDEKLYRDRKELEAFKAQKQKDEEEKLIKARREFEAFKAKQAREEEEARIQAQKELEAFKARQERESQEARIKKELELQRLRDEKKAREEKERFDREAKEAVEKYKREQAEKAAKEKREHEEKEVEFKKRLEEELRGSGLDERQISLIIKKEKDIDPERPTYTRMSRKYLSIETLNTYKLDYEFDVDPDYVLIKRWVPEYEQDFLWNHTREIRERRQQPVMLAIESSKKEHHHRHHSEPEFEFVRTKKKVERRPSPSPLLTFLAGGKPR